MTGFRPLLLKELREQARTFRFPALLIVLVMTGMLSLLTLLYLPQIIEMAAPEVEITLPETTAKVALLEFVASAVQAGVITVVLIGMGAVARERERGTAALVLSKPVSVGAFLLAKVVALGISLIIAVPIATAIGWAYAVSLFPGSVGVDSIGMAALVTAYLLFSATVTVGWSCFFRSQVLAGGLALTSILGTGVAGSIPRIGEYFPGGLLSWAHAFLLEPDPEPRWAAMAMAALFATVVTLLGWNRLRRGEV